MRNTNTTSSIRFTKNAEQDLNMVTLYSGEAPHGTTIEALVASLKAGELFNGKHGKIIANLPEEKELYECNWSRSGSDFDGENFKIREINAIEFNGLNKVNILLKLDK